MRTRSEITTEINANRKAMRELDEKDTDLIIELAQVCDDSSRYEEKEETWDNGKKGKRRVEEVHTIGRIYWNELFEFGDKPKGVGITIERSKMVKKDGVWLLGNIS